MGAHDTLGLFVQLINLGWKKRDETRYIHVLNRETGNLPSGNLT